MSWLEPDQQVINDTAMSQIEELLRAYGLESLSKWAMDQIVSGQSSTQVIQSLREQPEYKQRFQAIEKRKQAGLPAMSESEVIEYEERARELMRFYGLPPGFYDSYTDFSDMIGSDVGLPELESRMTLARNAAESAPADLQRQLADMYGVDVGGLTSFYLDPDRALPILERQYVAAEITNRGNRFAGRGGFDMFGVEEAEDLVREGVDADAARQAFDTLEQGDELLRDLPGAPGSGAWNKDDFMGFVRGDVAAQQRLARTSRERVAGHRGEGTGGFHRTQRGFSVGRAR